MSKYKINKMWPLLTESRDVRSKLGSVKVWVKLIYMLELVKTERLLSVPLRTWTLVSGSKSCWTTPPGLPHVWTVSLCYVTRRFISLWNSNLKWNVKIIKCVAITGEMTSHIGRPGCDILSWRLGSYKTSHGDLSWSMTFPVNTLQCITRLFITNVPHISVPPVLRMWDGTLRVRCGLCLRVLHRLHLKTWRDLNASRGCALSKALQGSHVSSRGDWNVLPDGQLLGQGCGRF